MNWRTQLRWRDFFPWWRRYNNEPNRAFYVLEHYGSFLVGCVLDVGCGSSAAHFRAVLKSRYNGMDLAKAYTDGTPDLHWDFESYNLPFWKGAYDTVLCIGTLEHTENPYQLLEECFRVARRHVVIQLPNNWPGFMTSLLIGHNVTHEAGYGLPMAPKPHGQRHKWFFNLEEACSFLTARIPDGWKLSVLDCTFEQGNDSWFAWAPYQRLRRFTTAKGKARWPSWKVVIVTLLRPLIVYPIQTVEWLLGLVVWGWRGRVAYHNLMCREIWAVYEKL